VQSATLRAVTFLDEHWKPVISPDWISEPDVVGQNQIVFGADLA
jgi:hypothetical protein